MQQVQPMQQGQMQQGQVQMATAIPMQGQVGQMQMQQQGGQLYAAQQQGYGYGQPTVAVAQVMPPGYNGQQQMMQGGQRVVVVAQPMGGYGAAAMGQAPYGAPPGGTWVREPYCGPITLLIGICFFLPSCFCPCDQRNVYIAPNGYKYNEHGGIMSQGGY